MKKKFAIGTCIALLACVLVGVLYVVTRVLHKNNDIVVETTIPVETVNETTEEVVEESTVVQEDVYTFVYGDTNEILEIPVDRCETFSMFLDTDSVYQALGTLLFDTEVLWDESSYSYDGSSITMSGNILNEEGTVDFVADIPTGVCELTFNRKSMEIQTIDNFTKPGSTPTQEFGAGSSLSDMPVKTVTTVKFNTQEIKDWDESSFWVRAEAPDTVKVVLKDFENKDIIMENYNRYLHHFFGDGEIIVWDYERLSSDVVVFYSSIGGWNVAFRVWDKEPNVIQATAQLNGTGH